MLSSSARASGADDGDATVSTRAPRATVARRASRRDRRERTIARIVVEISNSPSYKMARARRPRDRSSAFVARVRAPRRRAVRRAGWGWDGFDACVATAGVRESVARAVARAGECRRASRAG